MLVYTVKRFGMALLVMLAVSLITFTLLRLSGDPAAAKILSSRPEFVGQVRTTCVATMAQAGHALNALPQSAKVSVNCRIFPGVAIDDVKAQLTKVVDDPSATITTLGDPTGSDASPLREDVMQAVRDGFAEQVSNTYNGYRDSSISSVHRSRVRGNQFIYWPIF